MHLDVGGALVFVPFAVLSTVVHELGHVAGGRFAGFPAKSYVLGSFGRVHSETPTTPRALLLLTASGPLAGLLYGLVLVSLAPVTAPVGAAGVWAIAAGVTNVVPWPANSDGRKTWRAARDLAQRPDLA